MTEHFEAFRLKLNKRCNKVLILFIAAAVLLCGKLFYLQIIQYEKYQADTINQYTHTTVIQAKRGTIYDRNMKTLAMSTSVERVFIAPNAIPDVTVSEYIEEIVSDIKDSDEKREERLKLLSVFKDTSKTVAEDIAAMLSEYLAVTEESILEKAAKKNRADETIKHQVELQLTSRIKTEIASKHYTSFIHFSEETKRYYPYNSLASHIIGFCGIDGNGLYGVEAYYDDILTGENGKVVAATDGQGNEMNTKYESYIDAKDGTSVMLTIDWTCQSILDKYVKQALDDSNAQNRACGIVMDVKTAEILAMSTKPDFDLNSPFELDTLSEMLLEAFEGTEEEKEKYEKDLLYELWKNKAVTELYEPGSTFKIITSAMVFEENLVSTTEHFYCSGSIRIAGLDTPIHCHQTWGHGDEDFKRALSVSCNPVFVLMSQRLGKDRFYKYYKAFGYNERTGIDILGESGNIFFNMNTYSSVDCAVAAFGQNFKVTPLSHLRAICAVANGGYLVTPHVLKATIDENGNIIEQYNTEAIRQVVSTENCKTLWQYLYESVENGGNKNAAVPGYKIAAKTGTSTKTEKSTDDKKYYVASCVAFAPADDPEVAVIIIVDEPSNGSIYGATVSAPYVAKVMAEILPYLGVDPIYTDEELSAIGKVVSDYKGKSLSYATGDLARNGFTYQIEGNGSTVVAQSPSYGASLTAGSKVVLYTEESAIKENCIVPNLIGKSPTEANNLLIGSGLNIKVVDGTISGMAGFEAIKQSIEPGKVVLPGTVVSVEFRYYKDVTD